MRALARMEAPEPVAGIAPAREERSRAFGPSITVSHDLFTLDGTLVAAAGTRIDPFAHVALTRELLFIDGQRDVEVDWALARPTPSKIVLLAGRPLDLARPCCCGNCASRGQVSSVPGFPLHACPWR